MKLTNKSALIVLINIFFISCSAANIAQRGQYIDQKTIPIGTPRKAVLAKFGGPADTIIKDGLKIDIFRVIQGEQTASKATKAAGTIILGILTLGLSEIVTHPITKEKEYISFEVYYDLDDRVQIVNFLK